MNPGSYAEKILVRLWYEFREVPFQASKTTFNYNMVAHDEPTSWHWDFVHSNLFKCKHVWGFFKDDWGRDSFKNLMMDNRSPRHLFFNKTFPNQRNNLGGSFKQKGFAKKELSLKEIDKKTWKKKKKEGSTHKNRWSQNRGPETHYKKSATRKHRAIQRGHMAHGRYDELDAINSHKGAQRFYDWW